MRIVGRLLLVVAGLLAAAVAADAASSTAPAAAKGRLLFLRNCAECHGLDGDGTGSERDYLAKPPANLRDPRLLERYGEDDIAAFVIEGKRLRLELRPELLRQQAKETETLYSFIRRLPEIDWEKWEQGEETYLERCVVCHDHDGRPGTSLPEGVAKQPRNLSSADFQRSITDAELRDRLRHGKGGMPSLVPRLGEAEVEGLLAYVRILSPGYELYDRYCLTCHGARGEGGTGHLADAIAPDLAFTREYFEQKSADEIRAAVWHMLRDKNPSMPHFHEALSEAEVKAILEYLRSLGGPSLRPVKAGNP